MKKDINLQKIRFLPVSSKDLILALDRLTRFKYPEIKYYRVFSDLLCKYLTYPKLSKKEIRDLDADTLKALVEKVWNESTAKFSPDIVPDYELNRVLYHELLNVYNISDEMKNLADINLNLNGVLSLIKKTSTLPVNLKRLLLIENDYQDLKSKREEYNLRFPVEKVLLCEGATEEILLPKFAATAGYNFDKYGVKLISAGGKNQVAKLYCELKEELKIPVFVLLDADAVETSRRIETVKRDCDYVYLIKHGEFEDIFSLTLIKRTINNCFKNICECCVADFKADMPMTKVLCEFFRINNLGDYQKADFARQIYENTNSINDLTDEVLQIIDKIKTGV